MHMKCNFIEVSAYVHAWSMMYGLFHECCGTSRHVTCTVFIICTSPVVSKCMDCIWPLCAPTKMTTTVFQKNWKSMPMGGALMPMFVLSHLPKSSIKSSTLFLTNSLADLIELFGRCERTNIGTIFQKLKSCRIIRNTLPSQYFACRMCGMIACEFCGCLLV